MGRPSMSDNKKKTGVAILFGALLALPAHAQSVEDFYKGKTINLIIGYSVGGGYDLYGRLLARHIGKHIPGHPNIVPQNLTGAGSLRAAQFLYSVAPDRKSTRLNSSHVSESLMPSS